MNTMGNMLLPGRRNSHNAEIMAVEALDEIVGELIQANKLRASRPFLDWVNINATSFVISRIKKSASESALQTALASGNARHAMKNLVGEWMLPQLTRQFEELASQWHDYTDTQTGQDDDMPGAPSGQVKTLDLVL